MLRQSEGQGQGTHTRKARPFQFTHVDKILFPDSGITKAEVIEYYLKISEWLLPHLRDRPATLERLPDGLGQPGSHFWQKNTPAYYPDWIPRVQIDTESGKSVNYVLVNNAETLAYLVNQGTLTFHVWFSRVQDLDRPDFVLFDIDPGLVTFKDAVKIAKELHQLLGRDTKSFVKTSGKTGLHVLVPWNRPGGYAQARSWAMGVARQIVSRLPDIATMERSKARRGKRAYLDVMQNARGRHAVPPYVIRTVPGASVSMPLEWRELTAKLNPVAFNLRTASRRLARLKRDLLMELTARAE